MLSPCQYCNTLHRAFQNENFCSVQKQSVKEVKTNAFYFKSNHLNSGKHISRFSIRTISDGYQLHQINNKEYRLDKTKYLIIQDGESFQSEIRAEHEVEGLLVAFNRADCDSFFNYMHRSDQSLLDAPFDNYGYDFDLKAQSLELKKPLLFSLAKLKNYILNGQKDFLIYQEHFHDMLFILFADQLNLKKRIDTLKAQKTSTKQELYKRVSLAKEYLDSHLKENITLDKLSAVSMLSPFHFARVFKAIYHSTPHKYLIKKRIENARYLLQDSNSEIKSISNNLGFNHPSAFGRLFKLHVGLTPLQFRYQIPPNRNDSFN